VFIIDKQGIIRYRHVETLPIFKRSRTELLAALRQIAA
jgi:peroxiredoxin Q/BCP